MHSFCNKLDTYAPKGLHDTRWTAPYLVQLFEEAVSAVLDHVNIRILVDALDECRVGEEDDTEEIEDLVQKLRDMEESMRAKPQSLSICFACRHFPQLASLNKDPYIRTEWENGGAIEEYVERELLRITGDDKLRSNLQTEIIESANGNFLWASWVTREAIKLNRKGLPVQEIIRNTPGQLSTIYEEILRRLSRETSGMSLKLFQWLCLAEVPLSLRKFCFASGIDVQETKFTSFKELLYAPEDDGLPRLESLIRTLSGGFAEVQAEENNVVLIHQSVKDFLIKDGFKILDPEQHTHQKVMTSGHSLLLSSCLWWLTETELSGMVLHWMETFDPAIIAIVINMQLERDIFQPLVEVELGPAPDIRGAVKALSSSDRELVQRVLSELVEICESCSPHYREGMVSHDLENWTLADEIYACLVLYVYLFADQPSFMLYIYARDSWVHHALRTADNGGLVAAQTDIRKFCSRLKPEYATVYNRILGVLHVAAGIEASWVLGELLARESNNILDVNSLSGELGITPLMEAIRNGRAKKIQMLLGHEDIDVNTMSFNGQTALFSAVDTNCYGIVEQLIKKGAHLDIQDVEGETALMYAIDDDQYEIMNLLLENGASIHLESLNQTDAIGGATDRCLDGLARFIIGKIRRQEKEIWGNR